MDSQLEEKMQVTIDNAILWLTSAIQCRKYYYFLPRHNAAFLTPSFLKHSPSFVLTSFLQNFPSQRAVTNSLSLLFSSFLPQRIVQLNLYRFSNKLHWNCKSESYLPTSKVQSRQTWLPNQSLSQKTAFPGVPLLLSLWQTIITFN